MAVRQRRGGQTETSEGKEGEMGRAEPQGQALAEETGFRERQGVIVVALIVFRVCNALLIRTFFDPDEYWQSVEVAHQQVFGRGLLTWEWREAIRGYLHPGLFTLLFKALQWAGWDTRETVLAAPKVLQGCFQAAGDWAVYVLAFRLARAAGKPFLEAKRVARWSLLAQILNWFVYYAGVRTYSNSLEAVLCTLALARLPAEPLVGKATRQGGWSGLEGMLVAASAMLIRPTNAVVWLFVVPNHLWALWKGTGKASAVFGFVVKSVVPAAVVFVAASVAVDAQFYGRVVLTWWNFVSFNVLHAVGDFYGTHPWHWYATQGLPAVLGPQLPMVVLGVRTGEYRRLFYACAWYTCVFSAIAHKEFRFMMPIVPLAMVWVGLWLARADIRKLQAAVLAMLLLGGGVAMYTSLRHQRGTIDVMDALANDDHFGSLKEAHFLMNCHSTPFYSHMHTSKRMRQLDCTPRFEPGYMHESACFHANPVAFMCSLYADMKSEWCRGVRAEDTYCREVTQARLRATETLPSHVVVFGSMFRQIERVLTAHDYHVWYSYPHRDIDGERVIVMLKLEPGARKSLQEIVNTALAHSGAGAGK